MSLKTSRKLENRYKAKAESVRRSRRPWAGAASRERRPAPAKRILLSV